MEQGMPYSVDRVGARILHTMAATLISRMLRQDITFTRTYKQHKIGVRKGIKSPIPMLNSFSSPPTFE